MKTDNRGGPRKNAGRPKLPTGQAVVTLSICLPQDSIDFVDELIALADGGMSRSQVINGAIRMTMRPERRKK